VLVAPSGERSFVADRRAATRMEPEDLKPEWFDGLDLIHLPAYSLLVEPLGSAAARAVELARARGAARRTGLGGPASVGPLLAHGRREARELIGNLRPDLVFATEAEAEALLGRHVPEGILDLAAVAVHQARVPWRAGLRADRPRQTGGAAAPVRRRHARCPPRTPRARGCLRCRVHLGLALRAGRGTRRRRRAPSGDDRRASRRGAAPAQPRSELPPDERAR
jgi:hypothetical protein